MNWSELFSKTVAVFLTLLVMTFVNRHMENRKRRKELSLTIVPDTEEAIAFVNELEALGFFKYAKKSDVAELKENFIQYFDPFNEIVTVWEDDAPIPKDFRYYMCDGEDLFEAGGFIQLLETLKPTFKKIKFDYSITNHIEEWDGENDWLNHSLTMNGTDYVVFKNFTEQGWGEAAMRFAEILNAELEKQNITERIYLASGGNDGRLAFLTPELYTLIYNVYENRLWQPLEVKEWCEEMGIKPIDLT